LTPDQLARFAPHCDAPMLAPALNAAREEREIDTPRREANFLGQLHTESQGFTRFVENLNYSTERLMEVWPHRFPTLASTNGYVHNPQALADFVYAGRLGNVEPDDGAKFIGRGGIMITGRANYAHYGQLIGEDLIANPERAAWLTVWPKIAAAFWAEHDLNPLADIDDVEGITEAINGELVGIEDRKAQVARAMAILGAN
jgi:putative chitinase